MLAGATFRIPYLYMNASCVRIAACLWAGLGICLSALAKEEAFQPWQKKGRIMSPGFAGEKSSSILSAPCVVKLKNGKLRMYFWTVGKSWSKGHHVYAAEASPKNPKKWKLINEKPLLSPALKGNVGDNGPSFPWVSPREKAPWLMYFVSWGSWAKTGLSNRTSLALSEDEGITWKVTNEPHLPLGPKGTFDGGMTGSVCILREPDKKEPWRMWYTAGERYIRLLGQQRGIVHVGLATSRDGLSWRRHEKPALSPRLDKVAPFEAVVSKPCVLKLNGTYHMWLSVYQMGENRNGYRLGYARSKDGLTWERALDKEILPLTPGAFDSAHQSYPNVIEMGDELWMFYVGNSFGSTGIGLATMKKKELK